MAASVVILVIAAGVGHFYAQRAGEWEARVQSALSEAEARRRESERLAELAAEASRMADSIALRALALEDSVELRILRVQSDPVPPDCERYTAPRDSIISDLSEVADRWQRAYETEVLASTNLRAGMIQLQASNDSLVSVLSDRPRPRSRFLPEIGAGAFVGACLSGPCSGVGITLSWRIY